MLINVRFFGEFAIDRFFLNKGAQSKTIKGVIAKTKQKFKEIRVMNINTFCLF